MVEFTTAQGRTLDDFVAGLSGSGHRGLWLYGPRKSGTTTFGWEASQRVYAASAEGVGMLPGNRITAHELVDLQRRVWTQEELMRSNAHDFSLWQETQALMDKWDAVWNANVLLLDDLISPDIEFWKKHMLIRIDARLKGPGVTIIAGVCGPDRFGPDWNVGFTRSCTVAKLGDRGEG